MSQAWATYLEETFPGYLLPSAAFERLSVDEARTFLARISGRPEVLGALRATSTVGPAAEDVARFTADVTDLVRRLPSRAETTRRTWHGGFVGRLDIRGTLALHLAGHRTSFVTQMRRRTFHLLENAVVRSVCERLLAAIGRIRTARLLGGAPWGAALADSEVRLRSLLNETILREVPLEPIDGHHERAANQASHPAYRGALDWHRRMRAELESNDTNAVAKAVAKGALLPLTDDTRFEIAVLVRLIQALEKHLADREPRQWSLQRSIVSRERSAVACFERADGASISIYYNLALLDAGVVDESGAHYFANSGRMRPDITVVCRNAAAAESACVIEIKHSDDRGYLLAGLHEAHLYALEYASKLRGWPKAVLVCSGAVPGTIRRSDDVVAVSWRDWVPEVILEGLFDRTRDC